MELRTKLYESHVQAGGKIVPFAGYLLPVQYKEGVMKEHLAVRTKAGLFDVSHMGEAILEGPDALANLQMLVTNDCTNMVIGQVRYSPMCNEKGGVVDDLMVYKLGDDRYMLVINAANRHKDIAWMNAQLFGNVSLVDCSDELAQIALQGPMSPVILKKITEQHFIPLKYYTFIEKGFVAGEECIISRTGYTGEDGFEFYMKPEMAEKIWNTLLEAGESEGLIPCGLGARDTLRLEAAMPLYGHEMDESISPIETGLTRFVDFSKVDFIGKKAMVEQGDVRRKRVGLEITGRGIAREHFTVFVGDEEIGMTTSGTHAPYIGVPIAMAILPIQYAGIGQEVEVDIRGRRVTARVVKLPFYQKRK